MSIRVNTRTFSEAANAAFDRSMGGIRIGNAVFQDSFENDHGETVEVYLISYKIGDDLYSKKFNYEKDFDEIHHAEQRLK